MQHPHGTPAAVQQVLRSFQDHQRLIGVIAEMAREMERLDEDNRQLRAAVGVYREVARRRGRGSLTVLERGSLGKAAGDT